MADYEHLHESARRVVEADNEVRLKFIEKDFFVPYPLAQSYIQRLIGFATMQRCERMPCALIFGPSNNGKTALISAFLRETLPTDTVDESTRPTRCLRILAPPHADEGRLGMEILREFGAPTGRSATSKEVLRQVDFHLAGSGVQVLLMDELQHLIAGTKQQHRTCMQSIKNLSTKHRIAIVGAGTDAAYHAISSDPQLENRFIPMRLPIWGSGDDFKTLVTRVIARLPLRKPSPLANKLVIRMIHQRTTGLLGELVTMLKAAARVAITSESETITIAELDSCGYLGPEQRRNRFLGK